MIDTIHTWLPNNTNAFDLDRIKHATKGKYSFFQSFDGSTSEGIQGNYRGMSVWVFDNGVSIKGSLPKMILGNNYASPTCSQIEQALDELNTELSLPFENGKITRLDMGCCIQTKLKPDYYFPILGEVNRMMRLPQPSGIYWKNKGNSRTLLVYDKHRESKAKQIPIPNEFKNGNYLRFEVRYKGKQLSNLVNQNLTFGDLSNSTTYSKLKEVIIKDYHSIKKSMPPLLDYRNMKTRKDLKDEIEAYGWLSMGYDGAMQVISRLKDSGTLNALACKRLRADVRKAFNSRPTVKNELITELDTAIDLLTNDSKNGNCHNIN